jgi:hypothetical protein
VAVVLAIVGAVAWYIHSARADEQYLQRIFLAENCPATTWDEHTGRDQVAQCEAKKRKKAAATTSNAAPDVGPAVSAKPPPVASASASDTEPVPPPLDNSPAGLAKVAAGIAQFQQLVQQRLALGRESNDACMAKLEARGARIEAMEAKMGGGSERLRRMTRFACCAPNLGQTVEAPVVGCLMSCTEDDTPHNGSEDDDWGGPGGLREECQQAATALADWAADLKAGRP